MQNINEIFEEFAGAFVGYVTGAGEIALAERLDRSVLDFSLESLHEVDAYLQIVQENCPPRLEDEWILAVLRAGAYVGEVIRRQIPGKFNWTDFDAYCAAYPQAASILGTQKQLATCALLTIADGSCSLPINRALRCVRPQSG